MISLYYLSIPDAVKKVLHELTWNLQFYDISNGTVYRPCLTVGASQPIMKKKCEVDLSCRRS